jgi:hypothetical protein
VARLLAKRYDLPTSLGLAILITCLAFLALALGFERVAAFALLPAAPFLLPLASHWPSAIGHPVLSSLALAGSYVLPLLGWWVVIRGAVAVARRMRRRRSAGAGA